MPGWVQGGLPTPGSRLAGVLFGASPHPGQEGSWTCLKCAAHTSSPPGAETSLTRPLSGPCVGRTVWPLASEASAEPRARAPASFCCFRQKCV